MSNGYWGRILRVDLTQSRIDVEEQGDHFYRRHLGGMGMIGYYLLRELAPCVDPLGPDNVQVFAPGVITGTPTPGGGRNGVGAKSPMGGAFGRSEAGGFWGAELKRAGFDAIVVNGRAPKPVYLWVHDGEAEIRSAEHLWGMHTRESQEAIRTELGDKMIRTAQIGPGGEKLVRFACVINDLKHAAGRTGMGAVMGSKNLKAIAARGHSSPGLADPDTVKEMAKWMAANHRNIAPTLSTIGTVPGMVGNNLAGNIPTCNFRDGYFEEMESICAETVRDTIRIGMEGCYACPIRCKKVVRTEAPFESDPQYGGPEYETLGAFGSDCGVSDLNAIARAHHLCQAYTLDSISAGGTIAFAMECFESGYLTHKDTDGIDLRFGNAEAMIQMLEKIARREGIGDLLAEGSWRAGKVIGRGAEKLSMTVKGVEFGMHEPRLKHGLALGYCVEAHGADHNAPALQDTLYEKEGRHLEEARQLGWLEPMPANELSDRKAAFLVDTHNFRAMKDSAVMCAFIPWDHVKCCEVINSITGWNTTVTEALRIGERAVTMARVFNVREGFTREDDMLPDRFFTPPTRGSLKEKEQAVDRVKLESAKSTYYLLMGWDPETGIPTPEKLRALDLGWAVELLTEKASRR